jgi:hypothetical protein
MVEIRIYYECLEQALHYIQPIVEEVCEANTSVKLVRRLKNDSPIYFSQDKNILRGVYSLVVPDILITGVANNLETPLAIIEFTEAVTAEDHELQRSYGAIASLLADCFYIKISGDKQSSKEFGGASYNPYTSPKVFVERVNYKGFIIAEWKTETDNPSQLQHLPNLLSCPPEIEILKDTIQCAVIAFQEGSEKWFEKAVAELEKTDSYKEFFDIVINAKSFSDVLAEWQKREESNRNHNETRYFVRSDSISAKINRFSHVMDPDRGILIFLSALFSDTHKVFGVYTLVRPQSGEELKQSVTDIETLRERFEIALKKDDYSLADWLSLAIRDALAQTEILNAEINIHEAFEQNKDTLNGRVMTTLAYFLDGIFLNHNGVKLVWDKRKLIDADGESFLEAVRKKLGFDVAGEPLAIKEITNEVNEDEVTYAIVHRVLLPNGFHVVSVSYPGAQGGNAILPEKDKGLSQSRKYLDVIALLPQEKQSFDVLLNENKGMFSKSKVEQDIQKLLHYKTNTTYQEALKETLLEAKVIAPNGTLQKILIGIGFGVKSSTKTYWQPNDVDFIFRIESRKKWAIGIFRQELHDSISNIEGETNFPACYEVVKADRTSNEPSLFDDNA